MNTVIFADAITGINQIDDNSIDMCITSPPYYGLRDYGVDGQIGLENSPEAYISNLVDVFRAVKQKLKDDGTLWIVIGDSYAGSGKGAASYPDNAKKYKQGTNRGSVGCENITGVPKTFDGIKTKDLIGIPWMLAFALRADGWYLRQDIIWHKTNPMPESVKDRCTKSHEYIFLLSKNKKYYFNSDAITEQAKYNGRKDTVNKGGLKYSQNGILPHGQKARTHFLAGAPHEKWRFRNGTAIRNKRDVWTVSLKPFKGAHFATFPEQLITPCILAGSRQGGIVLDPFVGSGTTLKVAAENGRDGIGVEINKKYESVIRERIGDFIVRR